MRFILSFLLTSHRLIANNGVFNHREMIVVSLFYEKKESPGYLDQPDMTMRLPLWPTYKTYIQMAQKIDVYLKSWFNFYRRIRKLSNLTGSSLMEFMVILL